MKFKSYDNFSLKNRYQRLNLLLYIFTSVNTTILIGNSVYTSCIKSVTYINSIEFVNTKNNFDLTEEVFYQLLDNLKAGETTLFKQIFLSHAKDCISYLQIKYKASYNDAYDAMLDTMIEYRKRLLDGKVVYGNLRFLFLQMASQHYCRMMKSDKHMDEIENFESELTEIDSENIYDETQLTNLEKALNNMEGECKEILIMNYYNSLKLNEIAEKLGKNYDALRKQKERCVNTLIKLFNNISE